MRPEPVARNARAVGEVERFAQQSLRGVDRGELVTADTHPIQDVRTLDIRETRRLRELTRANQQLEGRAKLCIVHSRPGLCQQRAELELAGLGRELQAGEGFKRLVVLLTLDGGLGTGDRGLDLGVLIPGLPGLEIGDVDAQPLADPGKRLFRRARLAALDLAHVLLREAVARQFGLRQPRGNAKLA